MTSNKIFWLYINKRNTKFHREINVIMKEETKICFVFVVIVNHPPHRGGDRSIFCVEAVFIEMFKLNDAKLLNA